LFVGNLASAIDAILRKESPFKETYNVGEGPAVSTLEFVQLIGNALKTRPRLLNLPDELTRAAGRVGDIVSRFVPFPITSYTIDQLFGSLELDFSRLQSSTRYVPEFSMVDGLLATANWYLTTQSRKT
jgi:dTDP-D-glucose 4,6-dehydratase